MGFFETIAWAVGLTFGLVIFLAILHFRSESRNAEQVDAAASNLASRMVARFPSYRSKPSVAGDSLVLMIDESRRMTLVGNSAGVAKEIPFESFLSAEILTNGTAVAETQRKGTLGRAIVGGAIGGGVGAIIGAMTAKSIQNVSHNVTNIAVAVTTSDPQFPQMSWNIFQPHGIMQDLKPHEVWLHMDNATAIYNQFAPIFKLVPNEENGLVEI